MPGWRRSCATGGAPPSCATGTAAPCGAVCGPTPASPRCWPAAPGQEAQVRQAQMHKPMAPQLSVAPRLPVVAEASVEPQPLVSWRMCWKA